MKLLLAEDEKELSNALAAILKHSDYEVDVAYDGEEALQRGLSQSYDGIILDIMMPKMDGIQVLTNLRKQSIMTPILMLSAKAEIEDRILGLDKGADDYLTKPFAMGELLARVRAMTRRKEEFSPDKLVLGTISLDRIHSELAGATSSFRLNNQEFALMELFMNSPNCSISVEQILERVWKEEDETDENVVKVYVSYLQNKLQAIGATEKIIGNQTEGYVMEV